MSCRPAKAGPGGGGSARTPPAAPVPATPPAAIRRRRRRRGNRDDAASSRSGPGRCHIVPVPGCRQPGQARDTGAAGDARDARCPPPCSLHRSHTHAASTSYEGATGPVPGTTAARQGPGSTTDTTAHSPCLFTIKARVKCHRSDTPTSGVSVAPAAPAPQRSRAPRGRSVSPECQTPPLSSNRHRIRLDIRTNLGSNRWSNAGRVR